MRRGGGGEGDSRSLSIDTGRRGKHELGRYCGSDLRGWVHGLSNEVVYTHVLAGIEMHLYMYNYTTSLIRDDDHSSDCETERVLN